MKKFWASIKAAVTSPTAVVEEKNLAVFAATRILLAVGAGAGVVGLVTAVIQGLGQ